jgi:DNA-directed RNA polymerase specialized sigma24 family protein
MTGRCLRQLGGLLSVRHEDEVTARTWIVRAAKIEKYRRLYSSGDDRLNPDELHAVLPDGGAPPDATRRHRKPALVTDPAAVREMARLRGLGASYDAIGRAMGVSAKTVRTRLLEREERL